jgi:hypothetical protein
VARAKRRKSITGLIPTGPAVRGTIRGVSTRSSHSQRAVVSRAADRTPASSRAVREWSSAPSGPCAAHEDPRCALPGVGVEQFLTHQQVKPLAPLAFCAVAACTNQSRHPDGLYCEAYQQRLRTTQAGHQRLNETSWQATEPAIGRGGDFHRAA